MERGGAYLLWFSGGWGLLVWDLEWAWLRSGRGLVVSGLDEWMGHRDGWGLFVGVAYGWVWLKGGGACRGRGQELPDSSCLPPLQLNVMQDKEKTEMLQFVSVGLEGNLGVQWGSPRGLMRGS